MSKDTSYTVESSGHGALYIKSCDGKTIIQSVGLERHHEIYTAAAILNEVQKMLAARVEVTGEGGTDGK